MLQRLERANLFVTSLDSKRAWYRYHGLFAEALRSQIERTQGDLVLTLHHRASLWYAQHNQTTEAILHALHGHQWQLAADLIERISLLSFTWGASEYKLFLLRQWLKELPEEVVNSRPRLCLACAHLLWAVGSGSMLEGWLDAAEMTLTALLTTQSHEHAPPITSSKNGRQELENLLGEVFATRAYLQSYYKEDGQAVLLLCQQALTLLSTENLLVRVLISWAQLRTCYASTINDALAAIKNGHQADSLAQATGHTALSITAMGMTASYMINAGRLHEAWRMIQQAIQMGTQPGGILLPEAGWTSVWRADILHAWNRLDTAYSLVQEGLSLCKQTASLSTLNYLLYGYAVLLRISLSRGNLDVAHSTYQHFEHLGTKMNEPTYRYHHSLFITIDQVRLWLTCGELDRATHWMRKLDVIEQQGLPFARERQQVACVRILLAKQQPTLALERLEPVLQRATNGQRRGHVIEILILQALAQQMCQQETQALKALSEAIRLGEPEGYIRSFVDEGLPMATLLSQLREEQRQQGPTPYLDTLLVAFPQQNKTQPEELLSRRELEVLQLLARGSSNQEIAQELVITIDTVKRHIRHILAKLGVQNRIQATRRAQKLNLLSQKP